jgi:GNAT superfamily N-acetyltransferase
LTDKRDLSKKVKVKELVCNELTVKVGSPKDADVVPLLELLSENLSVRFGSSGKDSFTDWEFDNPKFIFLKAVLANETVGCGAIRPISETIGEIKRMFAKYSRKGIGELVLQSLEEQAKNLGYKELRLETRVANEQACNFYQKNGYKQIENYGKYVGRSEAICFEKKMNLD